MVTSYKNYLLKKQQAKKQSGFRPLFLPDDLMDFQMSLADWAISMGRSAIFADCGLGKTLIQLVWAENVLRKTNKPVLVLTPLAVSGQTISEGEKFNIEVSRPRQGKIANRIYVVNYEQLKNFDADNYGGVVCDESSILKSFNGQRQKEIKIFMRKIKYRLLCTATAAPNDYTELGTSSEALGYLGHVDMLNKFFKNDLNNSAFGRMYGNVLKWRFKGHAEVPFWKWVCSWAKAARKPSDLGFSDDKFILPELREIEHKVESKTVPDGMLFQLTAKGLQEQREERKRTIGERCEKVAELVTGHDRPALVWCGLNDEANLLEKLIKDSVQVQGSDSPEKKEERLLGFAKKNFRVLITKPKIGAWGLNYQHCSDITYFPNHSYEQYYQAIRRCWRFGQKSPVTINIISTEGELSILKNLQRKSKAADKMFSRLIEFMSNANKIEKPSKFKEKEIIPVWL